MKSDSEIIKKERKFLTFLYILFFTIFFLPFLAIGGYILYFSKIEPLFYQGDYQKFKSDYLNITEINNKNITKEDFSKKLSQNGFECGETTFQGDDDKIDWISNIDKSTVYKFKTDEKYIKCDKAFGTIPCARFLTIYGFIEEKNQIKNLALGNTGSICL